MDIGRFVAQFPVLTDDDQRMINRPDFLRQVDLAKNYHSQFHVKDVNDGRWFSTYGRKQQAEKYYRRLSATNESSYISDTAFCVAHLMLGGKLEMRDCGRIEPIRMAFIGRKKIDYQVGEPSEHGSDPSDRRDFWQSIISLPTTDDPVGDFVQDTKDIYESESWDPEPGKEWWEVCSEKFHRGADDVVYAVYERLAKRFQDNYDLTSLKVEIPSKKGRLSRRRIREIWKWGRWLISLVIRELIELAIELLFLSIRGRGFRIQFRKKTSRLPDTT